MGIGVVTPGRGVTSPGPLGSRTGGVVDTPGRGVTSPGPRGSPESVVTPPGIVSTTPGPTDLTPGLASSN